MQLRSSQQRQSRGTLTETLELHEPHTKITNKKEKMKRSFASAKLFFSVIEIIYINLKNLFL